MPVRAVDDKPSDTLVVVSGEGFWTGSSTLPHLHHSIARRSPGPLSDRGFVIRVGSYGRMNERRYVDEAPYRMNVS